MTEEQWKGVADQLRRPEGEAGIETGKRMNEGNALINSFAIEEINPQKDDVIVEIGMGNGYFVNDIFRRCADITYIGCDFSATMIEQARENNAELVNAGKVVFHLSEAHLLPLPDATADKLFCVNTLYFWKDTDVVFSELRRVMKPGGKLVIAVRPRWQMQDYPFTKFGFAMYDKEELQKLVQANNFEVIAAAERGEPDQIIAGRNHKVASLIVAAIKK